jgi:probable phosphoglycerate mutase
MRLATSEGEQEFFPVVDLYRQAEQFWRDTLPQHAGETILLVAHSGINRALIGTAVGLGPADYHALNQANCAISVLNFAGGFGEPVQLESVNLVDHLGKPLPDVRGNHRGPRMLLVRHGETDWNREKRFQGQIDVPLNENGRIQGEKAAFFLKDIPIDRAITSPMLRPKETAELILQFHPDVSLETDDRLKEISHGLWEGKLEEEIQEVYADELAAWKVTPETVQMPAGENLQQVWERAIAAWNEIVASSTGDSRSDPHGNRPLTVLVVAHDAVNKAILSGLMGWGPEKFWVFKQGNGAVTVIDYPRGPENRPMLQSLNITTHLGSGVLDKTAAGAL